jgi:hypothetical protein
MATMRLASDNGAKGLREGGGLAAAGAAIAASVLPVCSATAESKLDLFRFWLIVAVELVCLNDWLLLMRRISLSRLPPL